MGSTSEQFDAWFRERLERYEEPPGEAAWEHIAEKLGHTRKRRLMVFILRIAAGMALTLSLGLGYYYYIQQRSLPHPPSLAESQSTRDKSPVTSGKPETDAVTKENIIPEISRSHRRNAFADSPERVSIHAAERTAASGQDIMQHEENGNPVTVTHLPAIVPAEIRGIRATVTNRTPLPEMVARHTGQIHTDLTETDLIVMENLAQLDASAGGKNNGRNWTVGGQMAPLYSYRNLSSDYMDDQDLSALNQSEKGIVAYAGGIAFAYKPTKRLSVESGLFYSRYGQEKTDLRALSVNRNQISNTYENFPGETGTYLQVSITNSTGNISDGGTESFGFYSDDNSIVPGAKSNTNVLNIPADEDGSDLQATDDLTAFQYFGYLEVPLTVKYKVVDRKLDFNLLGGISTNFLAGNSVKISDDGRKYDYGETEDITRVNYSGSVGIGIEYPLLTNLLFTMEPRFRYYLNPVDKSVNLNVYPYSFGLFAGINFIF